MYGGGKYFVKNKNKTEVVFYKFFISLCGEGVSRRDTPDSYRDAKVFCTWCLVFKPARELRKKIFSKRFRAAE